jgi:hypothetical protein
VLNPKFRSRLVPIAAKTKIAFWRPQRTSEVVDLRWDQVGPAASKLHVGRVENSAPSTHVLDGRVIGALRRLQRELCAGTLFEFTSERGAPFTSAGSRKILARLGRRSDWHSSHWVLPL